MLHYFVISLMIFSSILYTVSFYTFIKYINCKKLSHLKTDQTLWFSQLPQELSVEEINHDLEDLATQLPEF